MAERLKQLEAVGRGAMAEVFRGVLIGERGTRREVAIKRLRADLRNDAAAVELFVNEARLAVRMTHPNVVHALELMGIPCTDDWAPENPACARDLIAIERHNASRWRRVPDGDQPGRIALLGNAKRYFHVGVTVPRCRILHTTRETGAVIQRPAMLRACGYSRIAFYEAAAWVR